MTFIIGSKPVSQAHDLQVSYDFCTLALHEGFERDVPVGTVHASTGILTVEYPLSYLGVRKYAVREMDRDKLPSRYQSASPDAVVRVLHTPDQVCKATFIQSAYGAPCVEASHPDRVHARYAPVPICGMVGTSHRLLATPLGTVPLVPALISSATVQDAVCLRGKEGSSLCYSWAMVWAETAGDQQCGDKLFRAVQDYDILHDMGVVNHLVIACEVAEARGDVDTRLIFDCVSRPVACYAGTMKLAISKTTAAALAVGLSLDSKALAKDLSIEIPDDAAPALIQSIKVLDAALTAVAGERDAMATALGAAEQAAEHAAAAGEHDRADAVVGRDLALRAALQVAASVGYQFERDTPEKPTGIRSARDVQHAVARSKNGKSYDRVPPAARDAYALGVWEQIARADDSGGTVIPTGPSALAKLLAGKWGMDPAAAARGTGK